MNEDEYAVDRAENKVESATIVEDPDVDHTDIPTIHEPAADDKTVTDLAPPQKAGSFLKKLLLYHFEQRS